MAITEEVLTELVEDTVAERRAVERRVRDLEAQITDLKEKREELLKEEEGHRLALARLFPNAAALSAPHGGNGPNTLFPVEQDLSRISRTEAIERAVQALSGATGQPTSPGDVESYLNARNRTDTRDQIGAALSYLRTVGRIERVGRGQWKPLRASLQEAE